MKKHADRPLPSVIMVHAKYRNQGGEEQSFAEEAALFERMGYVVHKIEKWNADKKPTPLSALEAIFNPAAFLEILRAIRAVRPQLIYVNNLWMSLSPSVLWAARFAGVPTLQAVRNYRLVCPSAKLTNEGRCLNCTSRTFPFQCIKNGCYNGSRLQSAIVALSSWSNRTAAATWRNHKYLATSEITKHLLVLSGIKEAKIRVRPNFVTASVVPNLEKGEGVAFVGRLSAEKGVKELVSEWSRLSNPPKLTLIGEGPLSDYVSAMAADPKNAIHWLGALPHSQVLEVLRSSSWTIVPSQWAEPFGRVAIESMSVGTPVCFTDGGALREIVDRTGILLPSISSDALYYAIEILENELGITKRRNDAFQRFDSLYSNTAALLDMKKHIASVVSA